VAALAQAGYALIAGRGYASLPAAQAAVTVTSLTAVGFVGLAILGGVAGALAEPFESSGTWSWLVMAGTLGLAIPTAAILAGFRRLGPTRASILMLLEPVVAVVLAAAVLAERPTPLQLLGGLLVLAGSLIAQAGPRPVPTMPPVSGVA
jgi:drug/metabolite transporter (DMT)-like permease